jgi:hypothetical protein
MAARQGADTAQETIHRGQMTDVLVTHLARHLKGFGSRSVEDAEVHFATGLLVPALHVFDDRADLLGVGVDDSRRDEDDELALVRVERAVLEELADDGNVAEPGDLRDRRSRRPLLSLMSWITP